MPVRPTLVPTMEVDGDSKTSSGHLVVVYVLYFPIFLIGLIGNIMVILVTVINPRMRTVTHIFITLLAVGDCIVVCFCMPFYVVSTFFIQDWVFGDVLCKLTVYTKHVGVRISMVTLTAMSLERYFVLLHPMRAKIIWKRNVVLRIVAAIVVFSMASASPKLYFTKIVLTRWNGTSIYPVSYVADQNPNMSSARMCTDSSDSTFSKIDSITFTVFFYFIPLVIIICVYTKIGWFLRKGAMKLRASQSNDRIIQGRQKVVRLLVVLVVTFAVCWLPANIIGLVANTQTPPWKMWHLPGALVINSISILLVYVSTMNNPLLYSFMSAEYRAAFKHICCAHCFQWYQTLKNKQSTERSSRSPTENISTAEICTESSM